MAHLSHQRLLSMNPILKTASISLLILLFGPASLSNPEASSEAVTDGNIPSGRAEVSGQALEDEIEEELRQHGFEIIRAKDWNQTEFDDAPNLRKVILDAPYASIYGHKARIEFLLLLSGRRILIETKRQKTSGSTDEKLPYVFANAKTNIALGQEFILVLDGPGWKKGAIKWIEERAAETEGFSVLTRSAFLLWLESI